VDAIKILIVVTLGAIVVSLGKALYHMSGGDAHHSGQMARALTVRISLSVALFVLLMLAWRFGGLTPHGVG
jgi:hypothetical protein